VAEEGFEQLFQASSADSSQAFQRRLENERRKQTRSRRIRWTLRLILLLAGLGVVAGVYFEWFALAGICLLLILLCAPVLFFMGGLAIGRVRHGLSDREKRLADD
jgi:hypothetical protein